MTTLTFEINDDTYKTAQVLAQHKKMTLAELFSFFVLAELFSFFVKEESQPLNATLMDFSDIDALGGCLAKYAKDKPMLNDEQINTLVKKKFAEKWIANESD